MAILKAVLLGLIGAMGVPYVMRSQTDLLGSWIADHTRQLEVGRVALPFSLIIFLSVTLFAWAFLKWAENR